MQTWRIKLNTAGEKSRWIGSRRVFNWLAKSFQLKRKNKQDMHLSISVLFGKEEITSYYICEDPCVKYVKIHEAKRHSCARFFAAVPKYCKTFSKKYCDSLWLLEWKTIGGYCESRHQILVVLFLCTLITFLVFFKTFFTLKRSNLPPNIARVGVDFWQKTNPGTKFGPG